MLLDTNNLTPIPLAYGTGFSLPGPIDASWYRYERAGLHHNYHFTAAAHCWPVSIPVPPRPTVDGFSPNLNKSLHAGHLKNLAVAAALCNITEAKPVAMLGASLGIADGAIAELGVWMKLARYKPKVYFDTDLLPDIISLADGTGEYEGCKVHNGVVVYKSDGSPTYAGHDLAFALLVKPDYYLTGFEQKAHFASLGLSSKHLPLGLVLDAIGQKMKSRTGGIYSAHDLFDALLAGLSPTPEPTKLAWNILAWQFNSSALGSTTKFNLCQWANSASPGVYITYVYARISSAIKRANDLGDGTAMTDADVALFGVAEYYKYYLTKAIEQLQPYHIAQYALVLAKYLTEAYSRRTIVGGPSGFLFALHHALFVLGCCMENLGMYTLDII
jgi:hypothetical protein